MGLIYALYQTELHADRCGMAGFEHRDLELPKLKKSHAAARRLYVCYRARNDVGHWANLQDWKYPASSAPAISV